MSFVFNNLDCNLIESTTYANIVEVSLVRVSKGAKNMIEEKTVISLVAAILLATYFQQKCDDKAVTKAINMAKVLVEEVNKEE